MNDVIKNYEKHKKAIVYVFFDMMENVDLTNITNHNEHGNTHVLLELEHKRKVFYSNSDLYLEQGMRKYITWFNNTVNCCKRNYLKNILVYDDCGFMEYIDVIEDNVKELNQEYYMRYGSLIAMILSINGRFLSMEHIRRRGEYPVIQDVTSVLKDEIKYTEPLSMGEIHEQVDNLALEKQEKEWILQGYAKNEFYIRENASAIQELIALCFDGGRTC